MHATAPLRILVVEDEPDIAALIRDGLTRRGGMEVEVARSGDAALAAAASNVPDVIVLDLNLPVLSGVEVFRILRARTATATTPVIMLTARSGERERIEGLEMGADDYVTKPFSMRELTARVAAVARRGRRTAGEEEDAAGPVFRGRHLTADFDAVHVTVDGNPVRLTRREFDLLRYLVTNRNRVVSRDRLLERVWGYDRDIETRSVDVHVGRLRGNLGPAGSQIETVVGLGYRFVE